MTKIRRMRKNYARDVKLEWVEENKKLKLEIQQYQKKLKIYEDEIQRLKDII